MFRDFLMSFRNKAYNFHLTPLTPDTLTPYLFSLVCNKRFYPLIVTCSVFDNE